MSTTPITSFSQLDLPEALQQALDDLGFDTPTPIQAQAIPLLLEGRDLTGVAQTGTGKTAAFGLPMLAAVDVTKRSTQALVLTPTRELALQVAEQIAAMATHLPGLHVAAVYGGAPYPPQQRALAAGAHIVVGTPGRLIDHIDRGSLNLTSLKFLVIDEADEMLRMGFAEDVDRIASATPPTRQVALFSATMPPAIRRVSQRHLNNPVELSVDRQSSTVDTVTQSYAVVAHRQKVEALVRVLAVSAADAAIVFVRTRGAAEEAASALIQQGVPASYLSGDVPQSERERIVDRLRHGAVSVIVATDVAARGLDVDRIGLVVNLDMPGDSESYVHRIGRTGRAGRTGEAITFVTPRERNMIKTIERATRRTLAEITIPTPQEVAKSRATRLLAGVAARHDKGRLDGVAGAVESFIEENPGLSMRELVVSVLALAVGDTGEVSVVMSEPTREDGSGPVRPRRTERPNGPRYRVAVGHNHGATPGGIVGALTNEAGISGDELGKIEIFSTFSLVDVPNGLPPETLERLQTPRVMGRPMLVRLDEGPVRPNRAPKVGAPRHAPRSAPRGEGGFHSGKPAQRRRPGRTA